MRIYSALRCHALKESRLQAGTRGFLAQVANAESSVLLCSVYY
jgi:hypothetical protein